MKIDPGNFPSIIIVMEIKIFQENLALSDSDLMQKFIIIKEGLEKYGDRADEINKRARNRTGIDLTEMKSILGQYLEIRVE